MARTRVAILGGGAGALSAAFALTATPELRARFEVTVHTLGWRLGGKGASGRNAALGQRIEEHGLHIWFGFYDNAFSVIRQCYEELGRPAGAPLATWTDAFKAQDECVQYERFRDEWIPHRFDIPSNPLTPGDEHLIGMWEVLSRAVEFLHDEWDRADAAHHAAARDAAAHSTPDVDHGRVRAIADKLELDFSHWTEAPVLHLLKLARGMAHERAHNESLGTAQAPLTLTALSKLLSATRDWIWKHVVRERVRDDELRMFFMWLDLAATVIEGIDSDELIELGFGAINHEEFRAWLHRHGANELTTDGSPLVRAIYDAAFCFEGGDTSRPNVAAGKAVQDFIRSVFLYKGAIMFKMQAGMGDTVFGPLHEVLSRRGVHFEFFRAVTGLGVDATGPTIDSIEYIQQATPKADYRPLVDVKGLPCWPNQPDWAQLEEGDALQGSNLEQDQNPLGHKPQTLQRGKDFDSVILGIPVGALPPICTEVAKANPRFAEMLDNATTVMTQAFQVWVSADRAQLGSKWPTGMLASCYVEPMDTYCDMSQVLPTEEWTDGTDPRLVAYFCGVLPDALGPTQDEGDANVRAAALEYLRTNVQQIWPQFDWSFVVDGENRAGEARFDGQYWRANFSGTERYVLTLAGSVKYRLKPDESGFENLALAGDWTHNGIDGGSVEAAVTSGLLAAKSIGGLPMVVRGTDGWLESDRGDDVPA